jgi:hypothetical protein
MTLPTVKPPYNEPPRITQAPDVNRPAEEGLEREQVVSVGRKPVPLIEICEPIRALPELNAITGSDSMFVRMIVPAETNKTPMKSRLTINLNETRSSFCGCKELMVALHCVLDGPTPHPRANVCGTYHPCRPHVNGSRIP